LLYTKNKKRGATTVFMERQAKRYTNKEKAEEVASRFKGFYVVNTSNKND